MPQWQRVLEIFSSPPARNFCYFYAMHQKKSIKTRAKLTYCLVSKTKEVTHDFKYCHCDFKSLSLRISFHSSFLSSQIHAFFHSCFNCFKYIKFPLFSLKALTKPLVGFSLHLSLKLRYSLETLCSHLCRAQGLASPPWSLQNSRQVVTSKSSCQ